MFIDGIAIRGYRSFGNEYVRFGPLTKINLIIGQNNSGKSNLLRFLFEHFVPVIKVLTRGSEYKIEAIDEPVGLEHGRFGIGLGHSPIRKPREDISEKCWRILGEIYARLADAHDSKVVWFDFEIRAKRHGRLEIDEQFLSHVLKAENSFKREWEFVWQELAKRSGGGFDTHWVPEGILSMSPRIRSFPDVFMVPAFRRIGAEQSSEKFLDGTGIIQKLAELQNPAHTDLHKKEEFEKINLFLQEVTGVSEARIEIPHQRNTINIQMNSRTLPIESLGTGIHEIIIIAAAAIVLDQQIMCVEEPELHVHPILQRKLLRFLQDQTTNQYFISTHSAHLLDHPGAAIFHVRLQDGFSIVDAVLDQTAKFEICRDLGYKASDIVQSNCVIWVEGPSDRIYLRHWIAAVDPDLIEGLHYSIMFYGGRLLSHLSANDKEIDEFISLRFLNRNLAVVIDSDKDRNGKRINATKRRIRDEFQQKPAMAWITAGREIENYVSKETLVKAVELVRVGSSRKVRSGKYEKCVPNSVDKIKVAHAVASMPAELDVYDLRIQVKKLVEFIHLANEKE